MNKFLFIYKFNINKSRRGSYNWNLLFPFVGAIIGCMTVALTLAIMEGMEYSIFTKLKKVSFPAKLTHISHTLNHGVREYLIKEDIDFIKGIEDQVLIMHNDVFRMTTIHAINDFTKIRKHILGNNLQYINIDSHIPLIYVGKSLAIKLDIFLGDTIDIAAPKQINIFTGLPSMRSMIVGGVYEMKVLDYDQSHIFTNYNAVTNFLDYNRSLYYLHEIPEDTISNRITQYFPNLHIQTWKDEHHSFISAMKLEKVAYSVIGFLIVGIAGFTLMSMMSLAVMQKVPQIGILTAMGATKQNISAIFIFQSLATWFISSAIGILLSLIIIEFDKHFHLIQILFPGVVFFDFPLILKSGYILLIMFVSLILLLSSSIYPSIKAAKLDAVQAIGFRR